MKKKKVTYKKICINTDTITGTIEYDTEKTGRFIVKELEEKLKNGCKDEK